MLVVPQELKPLFSNCSSMDATSSMMQPFSSPATTLSSTQSKKRSQTVPVSLISRTPPEEESMALVLLWAVLVLQPSLLQLPQSKTTSCRTFWVRRASWVVASMSTTGNKLLKSTPPELLPTPPFAISREPPHPLPTRTPSSPPPTTTSTQS